MPRQINRLRARTVETLQKPGRHADGGGLYLSISKAGAKKWVFLYRRRSDGKHCEMGLGSTTSVSLASAREKAAVQRMLLDAGKDPLSERRAAKTGDTPTFGKFAETFIAEHEKSWRNAAHRKQWYSTINQYCGSINKMRIDAITTEDVLRILQPIWQAKAETASRLRGRIERILDAATVKGHRDGSNPARWRGHLEHLLAKRQKLQRGHHPAMPWQGIPEFFGKLQSSEAVSARCLEFLILTAARSGEILHSLRDDRLHGMRWEEVNLGDATWTVPAERMKTGVEHRKPLSPRAIEILSEVEPLAKDGFVFPSPTKRQSLSSAALEELMRRMQAKPYTVHGFRSSFRDWAGDAGWPWDVAEAALAHKIGTTVEQAYRRSDDLERRRKLLQAWSDYCAGHRGNVIRLANAT